MNTSGTANSSDPQHPNFENFQVDGVAMGSPLGPILANNFLSHDEENWLNKFLIKFKLSFYRRYVDDISVLFK